MHVDLWIIPSRETEQRQRGQGAAYSRWSDTVHLHFIQKITYGLPTTLYLHVMSSWIIAYFYFNYKSKGTSLGLWGFFILTEMLNMISYTFMYATTTAMSVFVSVPFFLYVCVWSLSLVVGNFEIILLLQNTHTRKKMLLCTWHIPYGILVLSASHEDTLDDSQGCRLMCSRVGILAHTKNTHLFVSINLCLTKMPWRIKEKPGRRIIVLKLQSTGRLPRCLRKENPNQNYCQNIILATEKHQERHSWKNPSRCLCARPWNLCHERNRGLKLHLLMSHINWDRMWWFNNACLQAK